jgi:hypothetical protein
MTFRSRSSDWPSAFVPTRLLAAPPPMNTPWNAAPSAAEPVTVVPRRFPAITLPVVPVAHRPTLLLPFPEIRLPSAASVRPSPSVPT